MIKITGFQSPAVLGRLQAALTPEATDHVVERVAVETWRSVADATPKGFTGMLRRGWRIVKPRVGERHVVNDMPVMIYIERGTADEGRGWIYPRVKKALYIPLTRFAAINGWSSALKIGVDYILRIRVHGIRPRWIVRAETAKARTRMLEAAKAHIRKAING